MRRGGRHHGRRSGRDCSKDGRVRQGHPRRRRKQRHHHQALRTIAIASTEESRRDYREMLFRANEAMTNYISGVILYDETIRQKAKDGTPLVELIKASRRDPRHQGRHRRQAARPRARREDHRGPRRPRATASRSTTSSAPASPSGARSSTSGRACPSHNAIHANAHALARYAALCQEADIVPIVEPEVLMDGAVADPRHRHLLRRHREDAEGRVRASSYSPASGSTASS